MNTSADNVTAKQNGIKCIANCVPKVYTSAGTPKIVLVDMKDAAKDITTGNIDKFRFPVKNSLLFFN